jgi:exodeoxyribonuclease-3
MKLRIASWNINSVRLRFALVAKFVAAFQPHILCLQEIKCPEDLFPRDDFHALGFQNIAVCGQAGYHGVATLSKLPLSILPRQSFCGTSEARHLGCSVSLPENGEIAIHNIYVPAGGDLPDPDLNPKFKQKLAYLRALAEWCAVAQQEKAILLGDFNVAPLETDVWSHKQLLRVVSHTPVEVDHLARVQQAGEWVDIVRRIVPPEQKLYSWWSYRAREWEVSDRGRRLDHIWGSPSVAHFARGVTVLKEARGWPGPSDHVPVIADFELDGAGS